MQLCLTTSQSLDPPVIRCSDVYTDWLELGTMTEPLEPS